MTKRHSVEYVRDFCAKKNIILCQDFYLGNKYKLKLKCSIDDYEWNARFDSLAGMNSGCPKCAKNIPIAEQDLIEECAKKNIMILSKFSKKEKMEFKCGECNYKWSAGCKNVIRAKIGCYHCAGTRQSYFENEVKDILLEKGLVLLSSYKTTLDCISVKCLVCGEKCDIRFKNVLKGNGCKICNKVSYTHEYIKEEFFKKNIILLSKYKDALSYNKVECVVCGHKWNTKWNYIQQGWGCSKCGRRASAEKRRHTLVFVVEKCLERNIIFLDDYYFNNSEKHNFKCVHCEYKWATNFNSIYNFETGCPSCCSNHVSRGERLVFEFLEEKLSQHFLIFPRDRKTIKPYEIDVSLISNNLNIAVHYNGYGHYNAVFGSTENTRIKSLEKIQTNDKIKEQMLRKIGWKTITIKNEKYFSKPRVLKTFELILKEIYAFINEINDYEFVQIEVE